MFIVYIFEVPIIAFVLLFALVANTNVGEMAIILEVYQLYRCWFYAYGHLLVLLIK